MIRGKGQRQTSVKRENALEQMGYSEKVKRLRWSVLLVLLLLF